jgi:hypothetical protein
LKQYAGLTEDLVEQDIHIIAGMLFWYFRKSVVDNLIQLVALRERVSKEGCKAISVGSTRLSSDYDITVQGPCVDNIVSRFNSYFVAIFGQESSAVFDTNLYGSSFVMNTKVDNAFFERTDCADNAFSDQLYFVAMPPETPSSPRGGLPLYVKEQHLFALLKVYLAYERFSHSPRPMHDSYLSKMYDAFQLTLQGIEKALGRFIGPVFRTKLALKPTSVELSSYSSIPSLSPTTPMSAQSISDVGTKRIRPVYDKFAFSKIVEQTEYRNLLLMISSYNVYGNETYFTRGAFIDVVFNTQTCKPSGEPPVDKIQLTSHDLLDSFTENFGDYLAHFPPNKKYRERMSKALDKIRDSFPTQFTDDYVKRLRVVLRVPELDNPKERYQRDAAICYYATLLIMSIYDEFCVSQNSNFNDLLESMMMLFTKHGVTLAGG